jgi:hypothetical protein
MNFLLIWILRSCQVPQQSPGLKSITLRAMRELRENAQLTLIR